MNLHSVFEELDKLYQNDEPAPEELVESKLIDNVKKVATRVGADASTIVRSLIEFGETVSHIGNSDESKPMKLTDFMEYVENKAVLKALMSGNEKVMNGLTKEDIEELKQDIEEYKKAKATKKSDTQVKEAVEEDASDDEVLEIEDDENDKTDEEAQEESGEQTQFVLECTKCGSLVIKAESDIKVDENNIANIDEACQYCDLTEGYSIIGTLVPYEVTEANELEEGIFNFGKPKL